MNKRLVGLLTLLCLPASQALAKEPSTACAAGLVAPADSPAGIGVRATTAKGIATVTVCNSGVAIPDSGSVKLSIDAKTQSVTLIKSGDSTNKLTSCSKGFVGAKEKGGAVSFYESPSGAYSSHSKAKAPDAFVLDLISDCSKQ